MMTTWYRYILFFMASMMVWLGNWATVYADEFKVTRSDDPTPNGCQANDCSLREAVIAANNRSGADTITFQTTASIYQLQLTGMNEDAALTGDLDVLDDLTVNGNGKNNTVINGLVSSGNVNTFDIDRIFHVLKGNFTLSHITIRGGNVTRTPSSSLGDDGGGIAYMAAGKILSIIDSQLLNNRGRFGGGLFNNGEGAILNIVNSTLSQNHATSKGGGLNTSQVNVADLNIIGSAIISNTTNGDGAGVYFFSDPKIGEKVVMNIINTTIAKNEAMAYGGGVTNEGSGEVNLQNSTVVNNVAGTIEDGGGGGGGLASLGGKFNVSNSIVAKNSDFSQASGSVNYAPDCLGSSSAMQSLNHNLIGDNTGCNWPNKGDDLVGTEINPIDPKLGPLNTTSTTATPFYPLLTGSPAINQGGAKVGGELGACTFIDQQGLGRQVALPCDIGSYETGTTQPTLSLTIIKSGPDIIQQLGDTITYTLVAINNSLITATKMSITDEVPFGAFYVRGGDAFNGKVVSWFNGPLYQVMPSNTLIAVTFTVTSNQAVRNESYQINADGFGSGGFTGVGTGLAEPSLFIGKTAPSYAPKQAAITYTLTVRNDGKAQAVDVVITDTIPAGASYISGGTRSGDIVRWTIASLDPDGGTETVSFVVTATKSITNSVYGVNALDVTRVKVYSQTGTVSVFTFVGLQTHLPIIRINR